MILGGTQSGKSTTAKILISKVVRRESPINDRLEIDLRTGLHTRSRWRPLTIWVATPTGEKFRRDWLDPAHGESLRYWLGDTYADHREHPDIVYTTIHGDQVIQKSYDQGYMSFESSIVDLVVFDEEPSDVRVTNSSLARLATTNGTLAMAFTPLQGMSWSYHKWYAPCVERGAGVQIGPRSWEFKETSGGQEGRSVTIIQMGCADNPRARIYDREIETDPTMTESERNARRFGRYGFVEGLLFPRLAGFDLMSPAKEHRQYVIEKPDQLPRLAAYYIIADPNYRYGACLVGVDGDDNRYVLGSHLEEGWANRQHAEVFHRWVRDAPRKPLMYADMGSAGKQAKCDLNDLGLPFSPVEKLPGSVSASIKLLRGWLWPDPEHIHPVTKLSPAPYIYFYRPGLHETWTEDGLRVTGSRLTQQLATARQVEGGMPDTLDKTQELSYDLLDCVRYAALMIPPVREPGRQGVRTTSNRYRVKRLPTAAELSENRPRDIHPLDQEVYVPDVQDWWGL